ncbi:MAG: peptidoglycan DD-metalloendopeptidase family protein [Actinomycetota bacterium]
MTNYDDAVTNRRRRRRLASLLTTAALLVTGLGAGMAGAHDGSPDTVDEEGDEVRDIVFPIDGDVHYTDTWLYPRSSGRRHLGVDLMGDKMLPVLAAVDGCITYLDHGGPGGGNMLTLADEDGWRYHYIHLNNDTPGTDDGANLLEHAFVGDLEEGDCVEAGQHISYNGDSGNAEHTGAHLHFEIQRPDGIWINPFHSVEEAERVELRDPLPCGAPTNPEGEPDPASGRGLWVLADDGSVVGVAPAGDEIESFGDLTEVDDPAEPVAIQSTPTGEGYWIVDADGVVHPFGDAADHGDMSDAVLNGPVLGLEAHPDAGGYWLVADDGGVFSFGDSAFHGSMGGTELNAPVISMGSTASGEGYWLVAADGGVFSFGDAEFQGSTGGMDLAAPVISMGVHPDGEGYWLYAADGGVFSYGVPFHGSVPGMALCDEPRAVSLKVSDTGDGYWVLGVDGRVFSFGDAIEVDAAELAEEVGAVDLAVRHVPVDGETSGDDGGETETDGEGDPEPDGEGEPDDEGGGTSGEAAGG